MQVTLAGFNVDYELIDLLQRITNESSHRNASFQRLEELLEILADEPLTPETLSAAYARISRSPKSIRELRRDARGSLSRARRSNEEIVFGFGHASVAEHAVVNLDITGISRFALEALEEHRLASYTEKSQRYVGVDPEFFIPDEIRKIGLHHEMEEYCQAQFQSYQALTELLNNHFKTKANSQDREKALQDARYVLPLAFCGQVGMTMNTRTAEHVVRESRHSRFKEVRLMGKQIHDQIKRHVPSLMKYTETNPARISSNRRVETMMQSFKPASESVEDSNVILQSAPVDAENNVVAAMIFRHGNASFSDVLATVKSWTRSEKDKWLASAHSYIDKHSIVRKELELGMFVYSITLSASAYAQLKRHRMATLIKQDYNPSLGFTTPQCIVEAGGEGIFKEAMARADEMCKLAVKSDLREGSLAIQYILTNAHRRRVIFQANARELTHLSRLRLDAFAQWDIRGLSQQIIDLARESCPGLMLFAAGKDNFDSVRQSIKEKTESSNEGSVA